MEHITKPLKEQIRSNNEEIKRLSSLNEKLNDALTALTSSGEAKEEGVHEKRKYTKSHKRWKKSGRNRRKARKINGESGHIQWKEKITSYFENTDRLATSDEVLKHFYGKEHPKTQKVAKTRVYGILYWYAKTGVLKMHEQNEQRYYGLPKMFAGAQVLETYKP